MHWRPDAAAPEDDPQVWRPSAWSLSRADRPDRRPSADSSRVPWPCGTRHRCGTADGRRSTTHRRTRTRRSSCAVTPATLPGCTHPSGGSRRRCDGNGVPVAPSDGHGGTGIPPQAAGRPARRPEPRHADPAAPVRTPPRSSSARARSFQLRRLLRVHQGLQPPSVARPHCSSSRPTAFCARATSRSSTRWSTLPIFGPAARLGAATTHGEQPGLHGRRR